MLTRTSEGAYPAVVIPARGGKRGHEARLLGLWAAVAAAIAPSSVHGAAWVREPGEMYVKGSLSRLEATVFYDPEGESRPLLDPVRYRDARYREIAASFYVEYGVLPFATAIAGLPIKLVELDAEGLPGTADVEEDAFGAGDLRIAARVRLHRGSWAASLEPDVKLPLYEVPPAESMEPGLGSGQVDFGAALSAGTGIPSVRGYAQASAGYRIRGGSEADEAYWDAEAGFEPRGPLRVRFRYDGVDSRGAATSGSTPGPGMSVPAPTAGAQDFHRLAPTIALSFGGSTEIGLTWRRVVAGRNTIRSSEWELAIAFLGPVTRPVGAGESRSAPVRSARRVAAAQAL